MFQPIRIGELELKNRVDRLPDGHVLGRRRHGERLPPRPPRLEGARRRRPGDDRDDLRVAGRAGSPPAARGCGTPSRQRRTSASPSSSTTAPTPRSARSSATRARKGSTQLMWEAMDEPLADGNWEVIGPSALPYGEGCHVPREMTRADMDEVVADFVERSRACRRGRLRPGRAARGARLPAVLVPLAGLEPAHGRVRRITGEPAALPARDLRRRPGRCAGRHPGHGADLGDRLDARRQHRRRRGRDRPCVHRARCGGDRRVLRSGDQGREAGVRALVPDTRSPTRSVTSSRSRRAPR